MNLSRLRAYRVGGTLHIIVNNQVGFTTDPTDARSTHYASDVGKGFEMPIIHVNADDAEACIIAMRIAVAYRARFKKDFLIDLVGYRRWGHNEGDEPTFTQPQLYERIKAHPTPRQVWGNRLVAEGLVTSAQVEALDLFDALAEDPALHLRMRLEPGDAQFVHNHTMLHDRTAFEDWDEPQRRRHLLRLWLAVPGARPLPEVFAQRYGSIAIGDRGGIVVAGTTPCVPIDAS